LPPPERKTGETVRPIGELTLRELSKKFREQIRTGGDDMKLYRINKVSKPGGMVLKKRDVLAVSDTDAVQKAVESPDCPVCDVLKDGQHVASVV
jgi:hypothetical protein